ncbi:MAG: GntR family transcriptional regulator [Nesterenkonia sp.]|nr:GntR family transcriptional regulator [Nesterenkonia sp.]
MPIPPVRGVHARRLLRDEVYDSIRDAVVVGDLAPGEQLRDGELGEWLGVSRTPVREALLRLAQAGLVEANPGRTTKVAEIDPEVFAHCREIAAELYALAARRAAEGLTAEHLERMDEANSQLQQALDAGDPMAAIAADDAFHSVPVAASGNPLIATQLETVTPYLRRGEYFHFGTWAGARSPGQHEEILEALRAADGERAAALTRDNFGGLQLPHAAE